MLVRHTLSIALTSILALACGPRPAHPESSVCGSTLAPIPGPAPSLSLPPTSAVGRGCIVGADGRPSCIEDAAPIPDGRVVHAATDFGSTCAIYDSGRLWCSLAVNGISAPEIVDESGPFARLELGARAACAIRRDGSLWCRGVPGEPPAGAFVDVAIGAHHACALTVTGAVRCWGEGSEYCQTDVPPGPYVALVSGLLRTGGVRADGRIDWWGMRLRARPPAARGRVVSALLLREVNDEVVCTLDDAGRIACSAPGWVVPEGAFVAMEPTAMLGGGACAIRGDGSVACFGPAVLVPPGATLVGSTRTPHARLGEWTVHRSGPLEVQLPCSAEARTNPETGVTRTSCMRGDPAELVALEVSHPAPEIVAAGEDAMLDLAVEAKRLAFPGTRVSTRFAVDLHGRRGVQYVIEAPQGRMIGRAYAVGDTLYAVTGMYDPRSTGDSDARIRAAIESVQLAGE